MPNHIKNKIELIGSIEEINALIDSFGTYHPATLKTAYDGTVICVDKSDSFKFCWVDLKTGRCTDRNGMDQIGLPEGYTLEIEDSWFQFPDFKKVIPPPDNPAYRDEPSQEVAKNSPLWWYHWNMNNWGTKWNSYSCKKEAINIFFFETAWSSVSEIIDAISVAFPNVTIKYTWADEDTGSNCGRQVYRNGILESYTPESGSNEAYQIAFCLRPEYACNYELTDSGYKYKEN